MVARLHPPLICRRVRGVRSAPIRDRGCSKKVFHFFQKIKRARPRLAMRLPALLLLALLAPLVCAQWTTTTQTPARTRLAAAAVRSLTHCLATVNACMRVFPALYRACSAAFATIVELSPLPRLSTHPALRCTFPDLPLTFFIDQEHRLLWRRSELRRLRSQREHV